MRDLITCAETHYRNEHVEIRKFDLEAESFLVFIFTGKFTYESCQGAVQSWSELMQYNPSVLFTHIWDCSLMSGFEQKAKNEWMQCMNKLNNQTREILLISDNIVIRGAARIMSRLSKHRLVPFMSMEDLDNLDRFHSASSEIQR